MKQLLARTARSFEPMTPVFDATEANKAYAELREEHKEMTNKEFTDSLIKQVAELELHVKWLKGKLNHNMINSLANFGAWLVDNHECRFMGGEDEIAQLCSEYAEYAEAQAVPDKAN